MIFGKPTRTEEIRIRMEMGQKAAARHASLLAKNWPYLKGTAESLSFNDTFMFDWTFSADYIGDIVSKMEAVETMLADQDVIKKAGIDEMVYGHSLIVEMVAKLTRIIDRLKQENKK